MVAAGGLIAAVAGSAGVMVIAGAVAGELPGGVEPGDVAMVISPLFHFGAEQGQDTDGEGQDEATTVAASCSHCWPLNPPA